MKKVISNIVRVIIDKHRWLFLSCLFLLICKIGMAQNIINFSDLDAPYTHCYIGSFGDPCHTQCDTPVPTRHEVVQQNYLVPNITPSVMIRQGYVKLGNDSTHSEAEAIRYVFEVNHTNDLLNVDFFVFLQDHVHPRPEQSYFQIKILSAPDTSCESMPESECYTIQIFPTEYPDFIEMIEARDDNGNVRYFTHSYLAVDLHQFIGQCVVVEFSTSDCALDHHYGYAYYLAQCTSASLTIQQNGNTWHAIAPPGFHDYTWYNNNDIDNIADYPIEDTVIYCELNSNQACPIFLGRFGPIIPPPPPCPDCQDPIPPPPPVVVDTNIFVCRGESYRWVVYGNAMTALFDTTVVVDRITNFSYEKNSASGPDTTFHITLIPYSLTYYVISDTVCLEEGEYHGYGYDIDSIYFNMPPMDTLHAGQSQLNECDSFTVFQLIVVPPLNPGIISGDTVVCEGTSHTYTINDEPDSLNIYVTYEWHIPEGVTINRRFNRKSYELIITSEVDTNPIELTVIRQAVCDTDTLALTIYHNPSYDTLITGIVKYGHEYINTDYGLYVPPRYEVGDYYTAFPGQTVHGCDSIIRLKLTVYKPLNVDIYAISPRICVGDFSILSAEGSFSDRDTANCPPRPVNIGDFICADDSIFKPWELGNRVPIGVVFYVNSSGWHGSAVSLVDDGEAFWGTDGPGLFADIPELVNYSRVIDAIQDVNGYANTYYIRQAGTAVDYPAAYILSDQAGWYFPAMGQLCQLLHNSYLVNMSLQQVGADVLTGGTYWSSTEGYSHSSGKNQAWGMTWGTDNNSGRIKVYTKQTNFKIRAIKDF